MQADTGSAQSSTVLRCGLAARGGAWGGGWRGGRACVRGRASGMRTRDSESGSARLDYANFTCNPGGRAHVFFIYYHYRILYYHHRYNYIFICILSTKRPYENVIVGAQPTCVQVIKLRAYHNDRIIYICVMMECHEVL